MLNRTKKELIQMMKLLEWMEDEVDSIRDYESANGISLTRKFLGCSYPDSLMPDD